MGTVKIKPKGGLKIEGTNKRGVGELGKEGSRNYLCRCVIPGKVAL